MATRNETLLVVDDFENFRIIIRNQLKRLGFHRIQEASNGVEAMERVKEDKFDLLLLDINMKTLDGLGFLDQLRKASTNQNRNVPVIFITGNADTASVHRAVKMDIAGYLVKPVTMNDLKSRICRALKIQPKDLPIA